MTEIFPELPRGQDSEPVEAPPGQNHRTNHHLRLCSAVQGLGQLGTTCCDLPEQGAQSSCLVSS